jgi:hypothetical protein
MADLNPTDAAIARSLRCMIEDNLYFVIVAENYVHGSVDQLMKMYPNFIKAPEFVQRFALSRMKSILAKQAHAQGMGRHSR